MCNDKQWAKRKGKRKCKNSGKYDRRILEGNLIFPLPVWSVSLPSPRITMTECFHIISKARDRREHAALADYSIIPLNPGLRSKGLKVIKINYSPGGIWSCSCFEGDIEVINSYLLPPVFLHLFSSYRRVDLQNKVTEESYLSTKKWSLWNRCFN